MLFHYPIVEWDGFKRKTIHCYGHVHNRDLLNNKEVISRLDKRAVNVGVDVNSFFPVSADELLRRAFLKYSPLTLKASRF